MIYVFFFLKDGCSINLKDFTSMYTIAEDLKKTFVLLISFQFCEVVS